MRWSGLVVACGIVLTAATADDKKPVKDDAWESLVAAERAFSADSEARGINTSFRAAFEPGVLTFPPGKPIQVGTRHLQGSGPTGVLTWRPVKAEVSASGDFGYTTGPFEYREKKGDIAPAGTGCYASVWRRKGDGPWRVLADFGYSGPLPADADAEPAPPAPRKPIKKTSPTTGEVLVTIDHQFEKACASGLRRGYDRFLADDIRYYRDAKPPALGREAVLTAVDKLNATVTWFPERSRVADGGDLGYTAGTMTVQRKKPEGSPPEHLKYMRIWRKEGGRNWKVVLEVANAAPAPEE